MSLNPTTSRLTLPITKLHAHVCYLLFMVHFPNELALRWPCQRSMHTPFPSHFSISFCDALPLSSLYSPPIMPTSPPITQLAGRPFLSRPFPTHQPLILAAGGKRMLRLEMNTHPSRHHEHMNASFLCPLTLFSRFFSEKG